jgi:hypothetical protein
MAASLVAVEIDIRQSKMSNPSAFSAISEGSTVSGRKKLRNNADQALTEV